MPSETGILTSRLPFAEDAQVSVVAGSEAALLAGAPAALGLLRSGRLGALRLRGEGAPVVDPKEASWAGAMAEWWRAEGVTIERWDGAAETLEAPVLLVGGAELLEKPTIGLRAAVATADPEAVMAVGALGAEAARGVDPSRARGRLVELAARGALIGAEPVLRYEPAGRAYVELVENVNHRAGPDGQSVVGDTLRAALFGRHGAVPVNLSTRERPPALDLTTLLVFYVSLAELG